MFGFDMAGPDGVSQEEIAREVDSARRAIRQSGDGEDKFNAYFTLLGKIFGSCPDNVIELSILNEYMELAAVQKNLFWEGNARSNKLISFKNYNNYDSLIAQVPEHQAFFRRHDMWNYYYNSWNLLIQAHMQNFQYEKALAEAKAMYEVARDTDNMSGMSVAAKCIGEVYNGMGREQQAEHYMREAIEFAVKGKNSTSEIYSYLQLAYILANGKRYDEVFDVLGQYTRAIETYKSSLRDGGVEEHTISRMVAPLLLQLNQVSAEVCIETGDPERADAYLSEAEKLTDGYMDASRPANLYLRARLHEQKGRYAEAMKSLNECYDLQMALGKYTDAMYTMEHKARVLNLMGDVSQSYEVYRDFSVQKDSLRDIKFAAQLDELRTIYEVDRVIADKERVHIYMVVAVAAAIIFSFVLIGWISYSRKLSFKNKGLVRQIQEQTRLRNELKALRAKYGHTREPRSRDDTGKEGPAGLFLRLEEYMNGTQAFRNNNIERKDIASALGTNETYLYNAVRAATGQTLNEYINRLRIEAAKQMLEDNPRLTTEAILADCGFKTPSTFYRLFREYYDMSPREYRESLSGK